MRIDNRYEGANPRRSSDVQKLAPDRFLIYPWSEDGDGNYKYCLNVEVINDSDEPESLTLMIDWADLEYMGSRDYVMLGRGDDWKSFTGEMDGTVTTVNLTIPPGEWFLSLQPVYDMEMFDDDRRHAVRGGMDEQVLGRSQGGREIAALSCGPQDAPVIFTVCRFHPYETAGSYCVSAMLNMLCEDLHDGGPLTDRFRFVFVPMPNPDGLASGCCKLTQRGGIDLCHEGADSEDLAGAALAGFLNSIRPQLYLDLHGWMFRDHDGMSWSHTEFRDRVIETLSADSIFNKPWKGSDRSEKEFIPGDFFMQAFHKLGATGLVISPTWFGREVHHMRAFGRKLLETVCALTADNAG